MLNFDSVLTPRQCEDLGRPGETLFFRRVMDSARIFTDRGILPGSGVHEVVDRFGTGITERVGSRLLNVFFTSAGEKVLGSLSREALEKNPTDGRLTSSARDASGVLVEKIRNSLGISVSPTASSVRDLLERISNLRPREGAESMPSSRLLRQCHELGLIEPAGPTPRLNSASTIPNTGAPSSHRREIEDLTEETARAQASYSFQTRNLERIAGMLRVPLTPVRFLLKGFGLVPGPFNAVSGAMGKLTGGLSRAIGPESELERISELRIEAREARASHKGERCDTPAVPDLAAATIDGVSWTMTKRGLETLKALQTARLGSEILALPIELALPQIAGFREKRAAEAAARITPSLPKPGRTRSGAAKQDPNGAPSVGGDTGLNIPPIITTPPQVPEELAEEVMLDRPGGWEPTNPFDNNPGT